MTIRLHFPEESIAAIAAMGFRQRNPERLRWTDRHPASSYGLGVLQRGQSHDLLDGQQFVRLRTVYGAWIECESDLDRRRAIGALAVPPDIAAYVRLVMP